MCAICLTIYKYITYFIIVTDQLPSIHTNRIGCLHFSKYVYTTHLISLVDRQTHLVLDEPYREADTTIIIPNSCAFINKCDCEKMNSVMIAIGGFLLLQLVVALPPFEVPPAQVTLLQPKGFEVSIPGKYFTHFKSLSTKIIYIIRLFVVI